MVSRLKLYVDEIATKVLGKISFHFWIFFLIFNLEKLFFLASDVSFEKLFKLNLNIRNKEILFWPEWYDINLLEILDDESDMDHDVTDMGPVDKSSGDESEPAVDEPLEDSSDEDDDGTLRSCTVI